MLNLLSELASFECRSDSSRGGDRIHWCNSFGRRLLFISLSVRRVFVLAAKSTRYYLGVPVTGTALLPLECVGFVPLLALFPLRLSLLAWLFGSLLTRTYIFACGKAHLGCPPIWLLPALHLHRFMESNSWPFSAERLGQI